MAPNRHALEQRFLGLQVQEYVLREYIDSGRIGSVFRAVRDDPYDELACKVISLDRLRPGWEREIEKVALLRTIPGIVQYHSHGTSLDREGAEFVWVLWDYIKGPNLRKYTETLGEKLDLEFVVQLVRRILTVLHACAHAGIQHGDLHEGNILVRDPDERLLDLRPTIWVSDFGYGGSANDVTPKDDYRQLYAVAAHLVHRLDPADLNARDKALLPQFEALLRSVIDVDATQGRHILNARGLLEKLEAITKQAEVESAAAGLDGKKDPGDYLSGESLGYRADEWKSLFVPTFPAAQELLRRNTTVLTGARGCGKTMAFRRVTAFMDAVVGEGSGVPGAEQFVGFYVNCRDLAEAFPWIPTRLTASMSKQLIQYFHLAWISEILRTLARCETSDLFAHSAGTKREADYSWVDGFFQQVFGDEYRPLPAEMGTLSHTRAFIEQQKEMCRLTDFGAGRAAARWPLARVDVLDLVQRKLAQNVPWIGNRPLYMFLDDYTIPIVMPEVQEVINPIVFARRSDLFFKVSTESAVSVDLSSLHGKPLELHHDFELVDLASESIGLAEKERHELLESVFKPRIERHSVLRELQPTLRKLLGERPEATWNEMACALREKKTVTYAGVEVFDGMWSSDTRSMIQIFTELLRSAEGSIQQGAESSTWPDPLIPREIQDRVFRASGGDFVNFVKSTKDPATWYAGMGVAGSTRKSRAAAPPFGERLKDIVEAFVSVTRFELREGLLVSNQGKQNPRQAFRLEIVDKLELGDDEMQYFQGLIRWHIFLQDRRGKSVRGIVTPRLFLNRVMIPFFGLTFSTHDNISMTSEELRRLLGEPTTFLDYWKTRKRESVEERLLRAHGASLFSPPDEAS